MFKNILTWRIAPGENIYYTHTTCFPQQEKFQWQVKNWGIFRKGHKSSFL